MAAYLCGLDESSGRNRRDRFLMGGFVAPENDWTTTFTPEWEKYVLAGPPRIPYLHMTEIRSREWRDEHGISKADADARVDAAIDLIEKLVSLSPIGMEVDGGDVSDALSSMRVVHPKGGSVPLDPDYICFLGYVYLVLLYVAQTHPDAERVNFLVERNGRITKYIEAFHSGLASTMADLGISRLAPLVGELIPAGKDRVPLQAADLLCWHTARPKVTMSQFDIQRYARLARKTGMRGRLGSDQIKELAASLLER